MADRANGIARSVGVEVAVSEAAERTNGRLRFTVNHEVAGMLHARVLRSPFAHARVLRVDVSRALATPGVVGVLCGADLLHGGINPYYGPVFADRPLVAIDRVRYAGEPVAVVIAEDVDTAADALELIDVEYEPLTVYIDPETAIEPDAIALHDAVQQRDFLTFPDLVLNTEAGKNIFNHFKLRKGDVEAGLRGAAHVFEHTYRTAAQQHVSLEPHVAICQIRDGHVTLWSSSSSPYTARFQVAETLQIPQSHVRVITWNIGGAFGGKTYPRIEPLIAAISWRVGGRPVRLEFSRAEEFATICRHSSIVTLRTGVSADGQLVARKVRILWGAGAYADISPRTIKNGGWGSIGPYRIPHAWVDSYAVYTNTTPAGGFRGYAIPQVCWAYERQMDEIAHELGIDPVELRLRNVVRDGDTFSTGQVMHDLHYAELIREVADGIGWSSDTPESRSGSGRTRRGKGIAATVKGTVTPSTSTASIKLNEDGSVSLLTSTTEIGQGSRTVLAQIAADAVGVKYEMVHPAYPDTDLTPWDQTTSSSRSTAMMGGAVRQAGAVVQAQIKSLAAGLLEASQADLEVGGGEVWVRGVAGRRLSFEQVVRRSRSGNILGSGTNASEGSLDAETGQGIATSHFSQATCAAEVEVDMETGQVRLLNLVQATYAGTVVHPALAALQAQGNVTFGIGQALMEEMVYDGGQLATTSLGDYLIPSLRDLPADLRVALLEHSSGEGEVYGLGESGTPVVPAAIGNAIYAACGVSLRSLPMTPERVLSALRGGAT